MFKKIQIILMVCILFIGILPSLGLEAKAADQVTSDGFSYKLKTDGKGVVITSYDDSISLTPIIPSEIRGKAIVEIGPLAFRHSKITGITIPNSVKNIGSRAFEGATGLTSIKLPNSLKSISSFTFSKATGLTSIEIPKSVTSIEYRAFEGATGLTSIKLPNSLKSISSFTFSRATGLTSIEIPKSVTSIADGAFFGATALTSIKFHSPATRLDGDVFENIPNGLKVIGFKKTKLEKYIENGNWYIAGKYIFEGQEYETISEDFKYELTKGGLGVIVTGYNDNISLTPKIPNEIEGKAVVAIGDGVFERSKITGITIPDSVTSMGYRAFAGATELTSIKIPNSMTSIGEEVFIGMEGLIHIEIPKSVTSIGNNAFAGAKGLTSIKISDSVTSIGDYAFAGATGLKNIKFSNPLTILGEEVFLGVPKGLKVIGYKGSELETYIKADNKKLPGKYIFEALNHKVVFNSNGGTKVASAYTNEKDLVTQPKVPKKANYRFEGWYTNTKYSSKWNFKKSIQKSMTLYAKWSPTIGNLTKISNKTVQVKGITSPNSAVRIVQGSKKIGEGKSDKKGNFTIKISKVKAGTSIKVIVADKAGNKTTKTVKVLDKTAPAKPSVKSVKASSTTVVGKAEAKSTVYVYKGKTYLGKATTSSKGNYKVKIKKQKKGTTLLVKARDKAKNTSKNTSIKVK